jgi:hypothetical protein
VRIGRDVVDDERDQKPRQNLLQHSGTSSSLPASPHTSATHEWFLACLCVPISAAHLAVIQTSALLPDNHRGCTRRGGGWPGVARPGRGIISLCQTAAKPNSGTYTETPPPFSRRSNALTLRQSSTSSITPTYGGQPRSSRQGQRELARDIREYCRDDPDPDHLLVWWDEDGQIDYPGWMDSFRTAGNSWDLHRMIEDNKHKPDEPPAEGT